MPEPISSLTAIAGLAGSTSNIVRFILALTNCPLVIKQCASFVDRIENDIRHATEIRRNLDARLSHLPGESDRIDTIIDRARVSVRDVLVLLQRVRPQLESDQIRLSSRFLWELGLKQTFNECVTNLLAQQNAIQHEINTMKSLESTAIVKKNINVTIHNIELVQLEYSDIAESRKLLTAVDAIPSSSLLPAMPTYVPLLSSRNLSTTAVGERPDYVAEFVEVPTLAAPEAEIGSASFDIVERLRMDWLKDDE
jgi:hypothetical protein